MNRVLVANKTSYRIFNDKAVNQFEDVIIKPVDSGISIVVDDTEMVLRLGETQIVQGYKVSYYRNDIEYFLVKDNQVVIKPEFGDISISQYNVAIINQVLLVRDKQEIFLNSNLVKGNEVNYSYGDIVLLGDIEVIVNSKVIVLSGNLSNVNSNLINVPSNVQPFVSFPDYYKSPRIVKNPNQENVSIIAPGELQQNDKNGIIKILIPPALGIFSTVMMSIFMNRGPYVMISLITTLVSTVVTITNFFENRKNVKINNEKTKEVYNNYLLEKRKELFEMREWDRAALAYHYPSTAQIVEMIGTFHNRIYEKDVNDDFLSLAVGYGVQSPEYKIAFDTNELSQRKDEMLTEAKAIYDEFKTIGDKPYVISLKDVHLGLVGNKKNIHEQLKILLAQITFFQSYHDLEIIMMYNEKYEADFDYLKWYPHFTLHSMNVTGNFHSERIRDQILGSLQQILRERKLKQNEARQEVKYTPHYLIIIDDQDLIMNHPILEYLNDAGTALGFTLIYTAQLVSNLPEYIKTVVTLDDANNGELLLDHGEHIAARMKLNRLGDADLEYSARQLSILNHQKTITSKIPESITFFELYGISQPSQLGIVNRWNENKAYRSLAVPLGVRSEQDIVELNLHEKAHGPHGLVAGTTGSGKSEIIQSYILSLAVNYHPHEIGFLLIDYKGGGMASMFNNLPHLLGTITNLDGSEAMRALASIKSELSRRQNMFNDYAVNHIDAYHKLRESDQTMEPMPHLFIISDEFAELKKEQPEFISELVSVARVGRSLGIKLILATQKPSGVVDDQIWSNSKFKLALKVQEEADSKEIIKTSDAALITQPGRAYLQVGNNEIYELFQSAWSGAPYKKDKSGAVIDNRVYKINEIGQAILINEDLSGETSGHDLVTELDVVIDEVADQYETLASVSVRKPWLPPLPEVIASPQLQNEDIPDLASFDKVNLAVNIGLLDVPTRQIQEDYVIDLVQDGNIALFASSGFGKSTTLATIMLSLAVQNNPQLLNMYVMDLGNSALMPLRGLPHIADYMGFDDNEKIAKFVDIIEREMKRRKVLLGQKMVQNFDVYNQMSEDKLAAITIFVDNYDVIKEIEKIDLDSFFTKLTRDGVGVGIYVVVTATRTSAIRYSTINNFKNMIALYNFDQAEATMIVGRSGYTIPEVRGRGLVKHDGVNIMQVFSPVHYESDLEYSQNIQQLVSKITESYHGVKPKSIPILPEQLFTSDFDKYQQINENIIPIGLTLGDVRLTGSSLSSAPFLIYGPPNSGRKNLLSIYLKALIEKDSYLFDASTMEFIKYRKHCQYGYETNDVNAILTKLTDEVQKRKVKMQEHLTNTPSSTRSEYIQTLKRVYVFINDVDALVETADSKLVVGLIEASEYGYYLIAVANSRGLKGYDDIIKYFKTATQGVLLGEQPTSVFSNISYREEPSFGFGVIIDGGSVNKVMMAKYIEEGNI